MRDLVESKDDFKQGASAFTKRARCHDLDESRHLREFRRAVGAAGDRRSSGRSPAPMTCSCASMPPASAITTCSRAAARFPAASRTASSATRSRARSSTPARTCRPARVGERVVIYQRLYCGQCRYCLSGRQDLCRNSRVLGESGGGGYAEFTCAPARNAIRMPDGLDMTSAALAVCPVGTSVRAALGVAQVEPGADGADHRRRRRAGPAPDPGGQERERARDRGDQFARKRRRSSVRPAPTR